MKTYLMIGVLLLGACSFGQHRYGGDFWYLSHNERAQYEVEDSYSSCADYLYVSEGRYYCY